MTTETTTTTKDPVVTEKPRTSASLRAVLGAICANPDLGAPAEPFIEANADYIKFAEASVYVGLQSALTMAQTGEVLLAELAADIDDAAAASDKEPSLDLAALVQLRSNQSAITLDDLRVRLNKISTTARRWRLRTVARQAAALTEGSFDPDQTAKDWTEAISHACTDYEDVDYAALNAAMADKIFDPESVARRPVAFGWDLPDNPHSNIAANFTFYRGKTACLAAATGANKSVLAGAIGRNCMMPASAEYHGKDPESRLARVKGAPSGTFVLIVSTERGMPARAYWDRLQADLLDCQGSVLDDAGERQATFTGDNAPVIAAIKAAMASGRLTVIDPLIIRGKNKLATGREVDLVAMHVRRWVRQTRAKHGDVDMLVIIDYGQKLQLSPAESKGLDPRLVNVKVSDTIYSLASDLDVAMLVTLQLNGRLGKNNAHISDIAESSGWEHDADLVLKLDALPKDEVWALEELAKSKDPPPELTAEFLKYACELRQIINPKPRHGAGSYGSWLHFDGPHTRLVAVPDEAFPVIDEGNPLVRARALIAASKKKKGPF